MEPTKVNAGWARLRAIAYLNGRGISYGVGPDPIYPRLAVDENKYSLNVDVFRHPGVEICGSDFSILAPNSLDHIFIADRLRQFTDPENIVRQLCTKLKPGGHLIIHCIDRTIEEIAPLISKIGCWQTKDVYHRDGQFLGIWKLVNRSSPGIIPPKERPKKRALIARYGAVGDMIMISPLIRHLHEDGYHVTLNITPYCAEVLKHNPYVDNILLQERDAIPNQDLGQYWKEWMNDYDKYINLSESIEGKLLKVEGRRDFYTSKDWRHATCNTNYYDQTLRLGGYPEVTGTRGELYFNRDEEKRAQRLRERFKDSFLMVWALKGSSYHKTYPLLGPVLTQWLTTHPDAQVITVGSKDDKALEFSHPQVIPAAGDMPLRDVFALTKIVDLVAGPETAVTNAAGCFDTPKITFLTHSDHNALCKYWVNDYCLSADTACHPCKQLHYSLESCPLAKIQDTSTGKTFWEGPICAIGVTPERLMARLDEVYDKWKESKSNVKSL